MQRYKIKAVLEFLAKQTEYVTPNKVATEVDMSWATAKKILDHLATQKYVLRLTKGNKAIYALNTRR